MSNRRSEPRFSADQPVVVSVLDPIPGTIEGASKSGLRITTKVAIKVGAVIEIKWDRAVVFGKVCYCRKADGKYSIGLKVTEVIGGAKLRTRPETPDRLAS
jgi:hypothetical protein